MAENPEKPHYRIGEVSDLTGIKPHVLRYWESEFPTLVPQKSSTNQRLYSANDIEIILLLKKLLYDDGFTIAGARSKLQAAQFNMKNLFSDEKKDELLEDISVEDMKILLMTIRKELLYLRQLFQSQRRGLGISKTGSA